MTIDELRDILNRRRFELRRRHNTNFWEVRWGDGNLVGPSHTPILDEDPIEAIRRAEEWAKEVEPGAESR